MPFRKLGRNEKCWCGSGRKYKHCHLDRESQEPFPRSEAIRRFKAAHSKKMCLSPTSWRKECDGQIVQAHTVSKSGSLRRIARKGHVYSLKPIFATRNGSDVQSIFTPMLQGINHASTFSGFCARHDDSIFSPLEKRVFEGTSEQCFLLGYRALARELYAKRASVENSDLFQDFDKGWPVEEQIRFQTANQALGLGLRTGYHDALAHKSDYDDVLEKARFEDVRGYVIEFAGPPSLMCSGSTLPEQDFKGEALQDLGRLSSTLDLLTFSSFFGGESGFVVFSWLSSSDRSCTAFTDSLNAISDKLLTDSLLRFFFEFCENIHLNPDWWENLHEHNRGALVERFSISVNPFEKRQRGVLMDDGVTFEPWSVLRRYQVPTHK